MAPERVQPVKGWIIQNGSDPGQLHPEGPVKQGLLEPVYLRPLFFIEWEKIGR